MNIPIFDGHNDTLLALTRPQSGKERTFFARSEHGHIDLPRAREGGLAGGFFAVWVSSPNPQKLELPSSSPYEMPLPKPLELAYAQQEALAMMATLFRLEASSEGAVKVVRTASELESSIDTGVLASILHLEGAEAIDPELNALEVFYRAGLRSLGPVWSRPTAFGHGVPFKFPSSPDTGDGLTSFGQNLVKACNRLGIMIDLSHLNEKGFWDVARLSNAPLVATHSNVHALCPSTRNLTDRQLDAIAESDGMVGLNFAVSFLREDGMPNADTPLEIMVRHVDYLVERVGVDRVGLGSDFDGALISLEIRDVTGLPKLIEALRRHGYDDETLLKLGYKNWLRVLRKTWKA